jgi:hypothetical protein
VKLAVMLTMIFLLAVALFSYLMLPRLIESRLAADLKEQYGLKEEPTVEVYSSFPPELLIGRIDRIDVQVDQFVQEGVLLRGLYVNLENVDISVRSILQGNLEHEIWSSSLVAEVPEDSINAYLWKNNPLGLGGREIDVRSQDVVYRSADVLFGLPVSVGLDLWVSGPGQIEVFPQEATVGEFVLPPSLMRPLTPEERTLDLGELPLGVELRSVEPFSEEALVARAEK